MVLYMRVSLTECGAPIRGDPPEGGLATLPTTPPPLVGGSAREVSDLAVSLNVAGVGVGAQLFTTVGFFKNDNKNKVCTESTLFK